MYAAHPCAKSWRHCKFPSTPACSNMEGNPLASKDDYWDDSFNTSWGKISDSLLTTSEDNKRSITPNTGNSSDNVLRNSGNILSHSPHVFFSEFSINKSLRQLAYQSLVNRIICITIINPFPVSVCVGGRGRGADSCVCEMWCGLLASGHACVCVSRAPGMKLWWKI